MSKVSSILDRYPAYEVCIGIEVHVQLTTASKIFCSCPNQVCKEPNRNICIVCAGHPGVLPVLNRAVVDCAILAGLATHSTIARTCSFARKHYFYPDLPKNYQITQSDDPICSNGAVTITAEDGTEKIIRLIRIHMEEDAGKSIHAPYTNESFVDLNRAGTPLLEIVSQPDIRSAYEARAYLKALRLIVQYLDICSGNMEDGAFRADTNISVRKKGAIALGTKCELKNINSFKFISDAIEYEIERQITTLEQGGTIVQETRLWDTKERKTVTMRSKEQAADYRYLPDPDLPLITISDEQRATAQANMPELPTLRAQRLAQEYKLTAAEIEILLEDRSLTAYFERAYACTPSIHIINWVLRDLMGYVKEHKVAWDTCAVTPEKLASIVHLYETGVINNHGAQHIFQATAATGKEPTALVKELGLEQIGSTEELELLVQEILTAHPDVVADYKTGKEKLFGFFVGQAMKKTHGKGDPVVIQTLLKKHLGKY